MNVQKSLTVVLLAGFFIVLSSTWAKASPLDLAVSDDGSEMVAVAAASGAAAMRSEPGEGTGRRGAEALLAEGVSLEQPDVAAITALRPLGGGSGIESVIGVDTRIRTYTTYSPARRVVLITNVTDGFKCSGFLIGSNTVVTAGHCLHSGGSAGRWYTRSGYRIHAGANGTSFPYGSCGAKGLYSVKGWTVNGSELHDYGAIKLNCTVGNTVGWFGFFWQEASLNGAPAITSGYPGDKTGSLANTQWWSSDRIRRTTTQQVFYSNDTAGGMSGCPVWMDRPGATPPSSRGPFAMAVHGYGIHGSAPHSQYNHGKRITQAAYNNLVNWKNLP